MGKSEDEHAADMLNKLFEKYGSTTTTPTHEELHELEEAMLKAVFDNHKSEELRELEDALLKAILTEETDEQN